MKCKRFGDTLVVRPDRGEELVTEIKNACEQEKVKLGSIVGIGTVSHAVIGLYKVAEQKYCSNTFDGEMELTSLTGNVTEADGKVYLHLHANFAMSDGRVVGGHLNEAVISGTGEIFIHILNGSMGRYRDAETGLNVFDL